MENLKSMLEQLTATTISVSKTDHGVCDKCNQTLTLVKMPLLFGPDKGREIQKVKGCICWELEQAENAIKEREHFYTNVITDRFSTINEDLKAATFESYITENVELNKNKENCKLYAERFPNVKQKNIIMAGDYGTGKSHLSQSIYKTVRSKNMSSIFVSLPKLLSMIKTSYNANESLTEDMVISALIKCDLLVLDDLGAEKVKRNFDGSIDVETWSNDKLFEILDGRAGKHTIYTTNLTSVELSERIGGRNFSRLMKDTHVMAFKGKDHRLKGKEF